MPKASGSGNTGWGSSPNTSPENHRLVGGVRPSASRRSGIGARRSSGIRSTSGANFSAARATSASDGGDVDPSPCCALPAVSSVDEGLQATRSPTIKAALARIDGRINAPRLGAGTP